MFHKKIFAKDMNTFLTGNFFKSNHQKPERCIEDTSYLGVFNEIFQKRIFGMSNPSFPEILTINRHVLIQEMKIKFLGYIIDDQLSRNIKIKFSKILLSSIRENVLNVSIFVSQYNCYFFLHPYINYVIEILERNMIV